MHDSAQNGSDNSDRSENGKKPLDPQRLSDADSRDDVAKNGADASLSDADSMRNELAKAKNDFLYLRAEFENYKKQAIKERSDLRKFGAERLAQDILNVVDIFEAAIATEVNSDNLETFRKGIILTAQELKAVLQRNGIEEVPSEGKLFDPALHEALSSEESEATPGSITRVFKKPYRLHDRVIRPGQVVVAKEKSN